MATEVMKQQELAPIPVSEASSMMQLVARAASDPSIDVAKMKELIELQREIMKTQAEQAFNAAMARLQPRLPVIDRKGKIEFESKRTGDKQSTPFAKYEDIDAAIRPLLCNEGFSLAFDSEHTDKGVVYHGTLSHSLGHSKRASIILPADTSGSKNSLQAIGSTVSYSKRYLVGMLLNIVTKGQDDDGVAVGFITDDEHSKIVDMIAACEMDAKSQSKFLEVMKAEVVSEIQRRDYGKAMTLLQAKFKQRHKDGL